MVFSNVCPFCKDTRFNNLKLINMPEDESILFENDKIFVQVDISPLCRGHILIVTNEHYLNFYETPKAIKDDVIKIKDCIKKVYKEVYNSDVLFFEHGSAKSGEAGSSIDHAHLHAIPYNFNLESEIKLFDTFFECDILTNYQFNNEFSYIYLEQNDRMKRIYKVEKLPSQFMRKVVTSKLNYDNYLWQDMCITSDSKNKFNLTISDLSGKISI